MTRSATTSPAPMKLSKALQKQSGLAAKVRKLEGLFRQIFGDDVPVEWDVVTGEDRPYVSFKVGSPGTGECTGKIPQPLLDAPDYVEDVFRKVHEAFTYLQNWLRLVEDLFQQIRTWIKENMPGAQIKEKSIKIDERQSGEYTTKMLLIHVEGKTVEVRPISAWSPGTEGRLDLIGPEWDYTVIFSKDEGGWLWVQERPTVELIQLTEELFIRLVKDCMEEE